MTTPNPNPGLAQLAAGTTTNYKTGVTSNTGLAAATVGNPVWWNVAKTATPLINPEVVQAPSTAFASSNMTTVSGQSWTQVPSNFGPFTTQAAAEAAISGYIVVPEGTAGEIVNALATYSDAATAAAKGNIVSSVTDLLKTGADATGSTTYTTSQLTGAGPVAGAEAAGQTVYVNLTDAQSAVTSKNGSGVSGWEQAIEGFFQAFTDANTWIRVAKVVIGGAILLTGLSKLTGADKAIGGVAATAVKAAPLL
jgi:hypothetical protein